MPAAKPRAATSPRSKAPASRQSRIASRPRTGGPGLAGRSAEGPDKADGPSKKAPELPILQKVPSGIPGFDDITAGGLPRGRPTLICGSAGCGKTLFGLHFLIRGAVNYGEPGVFIAFEEREQDLIENVASLGFDLKDLVERKLIALDHIHVDRVEIEESGAYDLEGLFLRLDMAINQVGAKRVVIDTLETVFAAFSDTAILRSELRRLFHWLKEREVTAIITAERGDGALTRHGLEEYVSDCVVVLDHRVRDQVSTRRVRVVKYRGAKHETNEFPFLIDETGITVVPITSVALEHAVSNERVSTGVEKLDAMLGGAGYYRGSNILISGTAGAGKSSLCAHFADAVCRTGEKCLYVSYEESPLQIQRNMASIGLDLEPRVAEGLLRFIALRSTSHGLEAHLALLHKAVGEFGPSAVVVDPIGILTSAGDQDEATLMLVRLLDMFKGKGLTTMLSNLTHGGEALERTSVAVSSMVDTWLLLKMLEGNGERNRCLYVLKSRGMPHSNQIREFLITAHGIDLVEPYVGPEGVLTGTARSAQELKDRLARDERAYDEERQARLLERKQTLLEQRIAALRAEFAAEEAEIKQGLIAATSSDKVWNNERLRLASVRGTAPGKPGRNGPNRRAAKAERSSRA
jgi:circadian clock protein KaiC